MIQVVPGQIIRMLQVRYITVVPDLNHPLDEFRRWAVAMCLEAVMALDNVRPAITVGGSSNFHKP
jgi:hypothetical protein